MGNRMEARKSRARAGSAGCDRRTMRTDGSRAAASRAAIPSHDLRVAVNPFGHPKKVAPPYRCECNLRAGLGEEQCTRAEKGVGMRVCVCVCDGLCKRVCGLLRPGVTWHAPRSSRLT